MKSVEILIQGKQHTREKNKSEVTDKKNYSQFSKVQVVDSIGSFNSSF